MMSVLRSLLMYHLMGMYFRWELLFNFQNEYQKIECEANEASML